MKKKFLAIATIFCLVVSLMAPTTAGADAYTYKHMSFECYGGEMVVHDPGKDVSTFVTGGISVGGLVPGIALKDQKEYGGKTFEDPVLEGDVFEGWMKYQVRPDRTGKYLSRTRLSADDEFYTTEEILNQPVDNFDVEYWAKWASLPVSEYDSRLEGLPPAEEARRINVRIDVGWQSDTVPIVCYGTLANGWEFTLDKGNYLEGDCEVDKTIKEAMEIRTMSDPVIEGDSSGFLGWMISISDAYQDEKPVDIAGPMSTEDMLDYIIPAENPLNPDEPFKLDIEAVWEDGVWTPPILFAVSGNGGKLIVHDDMSQSDITTDCYYGEFRSSGPVRNAVPFKIASVEKTGAVLSGWTVYEADAIFFDEIEASFVDPDMDLLLYDTYTNGSGVEMNVYISLPFCKVIDRYMSTEELYDLGGNGMSYYAVANWTTGTTQTMKVNNQDARLEIANDITAVDRSLRDKFSSVEAIKDALLDAAKTVTGFVADKMKTVYMDITLKIKNADGIWETVTAENFPKEGVSVLLPYPEGTDKDGYFFTVSHMITSGAKAGEVEILDVVEEDDGLRVVFTSLSPVAITYQEEAEEPAPVQAEKEEAKDASAPATGDEMNLAVPVVILLAAAAGCTAVRRNRNDEQ